jgi:cellobionic acid phosphorylase
MATIYALRIWSDVCRHKGRTELATGFNAAADEMDRAAQTWLWDGNWFARGITDDGNAFGTSKDAEGRIFLNPQSWAMLAGVATPAQIEKILMSVEQMLDTPFGTMMLAPAYSQMREDIGRITQKHPGTAENGSIYNHAAAFYIFALYRMRDSDRAYRQLRRMLPGPSDDDFRQRGQLPVFVPNYYRGAVQQFPRTAGRSSQLFNTGAASWLYRILVEGLFGLKGVADGLAVVPNLPSQWQRATVTRRFRGSIFDVEFRREADATEARITVDGSDISENVIRNPDPGRRYSVTVRLPI